ncbi:hypothetical protein [Priestia flexa]|uniref:hypothetical protein n=1 Tax=Priestia flexa TaxID=86664 RepID=UPI0004741534|nr:hypothetical protein [Priestia flexa]
MKKEFTGYLGGDYDDLGMFDNKKDAERGMFPSEELNDLLEEFKGKKVKITVETFESEEDTTEDIKITSDSGISYPTVHYTKGISVQVGEIEQGVIDDYSIATDKFKSLLEKVRSYESNIKVTSDEIPVKYDGTEY